MIISPRRGEVRPISDLPDLVGAAAWQEVEGDDGNAYRAPAASAEGYPDAAGGFGVATADDEEWTDSNALTAHAWTVESNVAAPHTKQIAQTFSPSRLLVNWTNDNTLSYLSLYRTPTAISLAGQFALTFDVSGVFDATASGGTPFCGIGVRASSAAGSRGMILGLNGTPDLQLREYSNIGTGAFTQRLSINPAIPLVPKRWFLHLQRSAANVWSVGYSVDGAAWGQRLSTASDATAMTLIWLLFKRDAGTIAMQAATNWLRWNRIFFTVT